MIHDPPPRAAPAGVRALAPADLPAAPLGRAPLAAVNRALRAFAPVPARVGGAALQIAPCPMPPDPGPREWVEIDLAPGRLAVGLPPGWLAAVLPDGAAALPAGMRAEIALDAALTVIEAALGRPVDLRHAGPIPPDLPILRAVWLGAAAPGRDAPPAPEGTAILGCDAAALPAVDALLGSLIAALPPMRRDRRPAMVPLRVEIGRFDLPLADRGRLVPGATLVPLPGDVRLDDALLLVGGRPAARGGLDDGGLRLAGPAGPEPARRVAEGLDLRLRIDLPAGDAAALRAAGPGTRLPLGAPLALARVEIEAGGRPLATATLARLGPLVALRLGTVRATEAPGGPCATARRQGAKGAARSGC